MFTVIPVTHDCRAYFLYDMFKSNNPSWLKSKGYLHITPQIDIVGRKKEVISKVTNPEFVQRHAFFPLIHSNISDRKYKKISSDGNDRAHSHKDENGIHKKNIKIRPLHYASHFDALIFGYYAELLQKKYDEWIVNHRDLSDSIIAYRKIPFKGEDKHKSTIHFAHEIFEEIKNRSNTSKEPSMVLTFDIKSFFSTLDHSLLKETWADFLGEKRLPPDHYNVFKAATQFSYILLDELRMPNEKNSRKRGFDEKELARIRNKYGIHAMFESPKAFRDKVKNGSIKLYKYPFRDKETKEPKGIPQGLPISATLANLYLRDFDLKILESVVQNYNCYYRRYSDDIVVVCSSACAAEVESIIKSELEKNKMELSINKTERYIFKYLPSGKNHLKLTSVKLSENGDKVGVPFSYLGFEFYGEKVLIKSANVAKFYRRMISSVKSKAKRAKLIAEETPGEKSVLFRRQLHKLYTTYPLQNVTVRKRWKKIVKLENGDFRLVTGIKKQSLRSNYLTYVKRSSKIMNEPSIEKQLKKHKAIFNQTIHRHLKRN